MTRTLLYCVMIGSMALLAWITFGDTWKPASRLQRIANIVWFFLFVGLMVWFLLRPVQRPPKSTAARIDRVVATTLGLLAAVWVAICIYGMATLG
jgi:hypothetical protein